MTSKTLKEAPEKLFLFQYEDGRFEMYNRDTFLVSSNEKYEPSDKVTEYIRKDIYDKQISFLKKSIGVMILQTNISDPQEARRIVIQTGQQALKQIEKESE